MTTTPRPLLALTLLVLCTMQMHAYAQTCPELQAQINCLKNFAPSTLSAPYIAEDCSVFAGLSSGIYTLSSGAKVYCDITPTNAWTLLSTFEQPQGKPLLDLPYDIYAKYLQDAPTWIGGASEGGVPPTSPEPLNDGSFHIKSANWKSILKTGKQYRLRQRFFKGSGTTKTALFDVSYKFTYTGFTLQNESPNAADRAFTLTDRIVHQDTTAIQWDVKTETVRFWLPFTPTVTGNVYTGCGGYDLSPTACGIQFRRSGNAGIIGSTGDTRDPAGAWAPHASTAPFADLVYVHQRTDVYGLTAASTGPIFLAYYIAPV